jgi:NAD(P)-dependent dehydrogenase (short-subunit alcohol dehydrogenase family)
MGEGDRDLTGDLEGKGALVTGAGSGIGRAMARALAAEGAGVLVADVAVEGGEETVRLIEEAGGQAVFKQTDVSDGSQVEALVAATVETWGRLDCALNNAGIAGEAQTPLADTRIDRFDRIMAVNLRGVFLCMKYELQQMLEQGGGAIVNTASTMGLVATPHSPSYVASKHGVIGLTKSAAIAYADQSIRVNAVCPGNTETAILDPTKKAAAPVIDQLIANTPMKRLGDPMEIAKAAVWLCSDAASFCTGHAMVVDGGFVAR